MAADDPFTLSLPLTVTCPAGTFPGDLLWVDAAGGLVFGAERHLAPGEHADLRLDLPEGPEILVMARVQQAGPAAITHFDHPWLHLADYTVPDREHARLLRRFLGLEEGGRAAAAEPETLELLPDPVPERLPHTALSDDVPHELLLGFPDRATLREALSFSGGTTFCTCGYLELELESEVAVTLALPGGTFLQARGLLKRHTLGATVVELAWLAGADRAWLAREAERP